MDLQELLDESARSWQYDKPDSPERQMVHTMIRLKRGPAPACFGQDDCSGSALMSCGWRIDCGVP